MGNTMSKSKDTLFHTIDDLHNDLYAIRQQLCLMADLTAYEQASDTLITINPTSFSTTMTRLADQIQEAMNRASGLYQYEQQK